MLVLTRKAHQRIQIGNDITITILRVKGQSVRVGIEAPPEVSIRRAELQQFDADDVSESAEEEEPPARRGPVCMQPTLL